MCQYPKQGKPPRCKVDPEVLSKTLALRLQVASAGTDRKSFVRRKELMNPLTTNMSKLVDWIKWDGIDQYRRWPEKGQGKL